MNQSNEKTAAFFSEMIKLKETNFGEVNKLAKN